MDYYFWIGLGVTVWALGWTTLFRYRKFTEEYAAKSYAPPAAMWVYSGLAAAGISTGVLLLVWLAAVLDNRGLLAPAGMGTVGALVAVVPFAWFIRRQQKLAAE